MKTQKWKEKVQTIYNSCQSEFKKTTTIGKKMVTASQTNSQLKSVFEELGQITAGAMRNNEITWEDPKVYKILEKIDALERELEEFEVDVNKIKTSNS